MTNASEAKLPSSDLTFITNEAGQSLCDRFAALLHKDTRFFDCLVGYFFISGFHRIYPSLENVEKIRILAGLQTDRSAYDLLQRAKEQGELDLQSHASSKEQAVETEVEGVRTRVMTAEHLVAIALQVGRAKDQARIVQFVESGVLDPNKLEEILARHSLLEKWERIRIKYFNGGS